MFSKNVFCGATSPLLPPGILGLKSSGQDPRRGRGDAGRKGAGRGGKGGEDRVQGRGGAAAAAGSPDCVTSPTRMSSSGEERQAVHGSSAPPAAAAQTVAVPHTGLGNCRLRRAQCACAAPAVAVPPVLKPGLRPQRRSPGRGLSISAPGPRPGVRGEKERLQATRVQAPSARS